MTLMQAFKVWWSYSWRSSILVIPLWTIITVWSLVGLFSAVQNMQLSGQSLDSMSIGQLARTACGGDSGLRHALDAQLSLVGFSAEGGAAGRGGWKRVRPGKFDPAGEGVKAP